MRLHRGCQPPCPQQDLGMATASSPVCREASLGCGGHFRPSAPGRDRKAWVGSGGSRWVNMSMNGAENSHAGAGHGELRSWPMQTTLGLVRFTLSRASPQGSQPGWFLSSPTRPYSRTPFNRECCDVFGKGQVVELYLKWPLVPVPGCQFQSWLLRFGSVSPLWCQAE